jgi:CRISPR-associated protein Csb2
MPEERMLQIRVTFPHDYYSGAEFGAAEDVPSFARLHEALVAAAAGGPWADVDGKVLVARDDHRAALEWLEETEPIGVVAPETRLTLARALRYRWRCSPVDPVPTSFEPRAAVAGSIVYCWPSAPREVTVALRTIAHDVTHVGRADSIAIVKVSEAVRPKALYERAEHRGPGRVMRVPREGRTRVLVRAHADATKRGDYPVAAGKQAYDRHVTGANEQATVLQRFAPPVVGIDWPYSEVWAAEIDVDGASAARLLDPRMRVPAAVGIHRAVVGAIGRLTEDDIPPFVTGRDGEGPLRGPGHLAIQLAADDRSSKLLALFGIPPDVPDADREILRAALDRPLRAKPFGRRGRYFQFGSLRVRSALPYWIERTPILRTAVPFVLDAPGHPRRGPWSIEDATVCSIGYAMRGVLERAGIEWGRGWEFRRNLVALLRGEYGVSVVARRVPTAASRFLHRADPGELAVAVHAAVNLGRLAPMRGGFLALGRARHLGGGLLVPLDQEGA